MHTNTRSKWQIYKELELIPDSVPQPQLTYPDEKPAWFGKIWKWLTEFSKPNYEPKIWQTTDNNGATWWNVYDPIAAHTFYMASEEEVLFWLDQYHGIG